MSLNRIFPCAMAVCLCALLSAATVNAQVSTRQTSVTATTAGGPRLETDPIIISTANVPAANVSMAQPAVPALNQLLMAAIDERLGAPYIYGSTGPRGYDFSGFVWSVFHSSGIDFYRG